MATMKPMLVYFPGAGRGELSRLISAAGQIAIDDWFPGLDFKQHVGFFGSMPMIKHGSFQVCQSSACEKYLASISPRFKDLTPQQIAVDNMFIHTLEDIRQVCYKIQFGNEEAKRQAPQTIPKQLDKFLAAIEEMMPESGFMHGLEFPTAADLAMLNFAESLGPFQVATQAANYDWQTKFPKIKAVAERCITVPGVREYVNKSETLRVDINFGFKAKVASKLIFHKLTLGLCYGFNPHDRGTAPPKTDFKRASGPVISDSPKLMYFPIAGRGELARLISAAGGVPLRDASPGEDWKTKVGFFGSMPVLEHGPLKISQSGAIETYLAAIAPKFKDLTPQQRAYDDMFAATKEDVLAALAKIVFGGEELKKSAPQEVPNTLDKFFSVLEKLTPASGFIQGLSFPTTADLVLLNMTQGAMPFTKAMELAGGYDWQSKFPSIKANVDRTKEAPGVKEYLAQSTSLNAVPA